ncbi:glycosyltransferase family 2 protein [Deinococcus pimensis]|uniref:glycosyltransferase family 2 protein n=1 Tax=Deinococcus pimensis TaxID=309888 RepID=UPI00146FBEC6|nr:glycosyltransferase [Deinococcus pimensis]
MSVLIPTHNAAEFLAEAITSALTQDEELEVVVVDDASTDATAQVLTGIRDARVRSVRLDRPHGVHGALNVGLGLCRGEFVARLDADDVMLPGRLALQSAFLDAHRSVLAVGAQARTFGAREERLDYPVSAAQTRAWSLFSCPLAHPATTFRRAAVKAYPAVAFAEDYALWASLLDAGELANVEEVLLAWRMHGGRVSVRYAAAQRAGTRLVWTRQLRRLGVEASPAELEVHARLQFARFRDVEVSLEEAVVMRAWAQRLLWACEVSGGVGLEALEAELEVRLGRVVVVDSVA